METIKSYTNIEQSKRLAEILPIESADMYWWYNGQKYYAETIDHNYFQTRDVPCWSLAALLDVLPTLDDRNAEFCKDIKYDKWHVYYHSTATLSIIDTDRYENLIDAVYEMIMKLYKTNLL